MIKHPREKALNQHISANAHSCLFLANPMATESTLSEPANPEAAPTSRIATLRSRAFLSDLPDDFLNPSGSSTTVAADSQRQGGAFG